MAYIRSLAIALLVFNAAGTTRGLDIIWISEGRNPAEAAAYSSATAQGWNIQNPASTTPYDQGWVNLLIADGHNVTYHTKANTGNATTNWLNNGYWQGTLSQSQKDELNAADLVIVSPDFNGTQYNAGGTGRLDWNALTVPMITLSPEAVTKDVWYWSERTLANVHSFNLITNDASGRADRVAGLPNQGNNTQPYYQRAFAACCAGSASQLQLRSSNDSVQWDILDETSGSRAMSYLRADVSEFVDQASNGASTLDFTRLFATSGDSYVEDTYWTLPSPNNGAGMIYELRWDAGQKWCINGCDTSVTPPSAGTREFFNAAGAANTNVGGFYQGAGQENLNTAGEAIFLDNVKRVAANNDLSQIRQNRQAPFFTPTVDGNVTPEELSSQLKIPMTVARNGVAAADQMRGGTVENSSNAQNGMLPEGGNANSQTCVECNFDPKELSGNYYVSWDSQNFYLTTVVKDNKPTFFLSRDQRYVHDTSFLPHDAVGIDFNPRDNAAKVGKKTFEATVNTYENNGPSFMRDNATDTHAEMVSFGAVIAGHQTVDGSSNVDGYVLEMKIPWSVMMTGNGGDTYVPQPGDQHGIGFHLSGWDGFDLTAQSRANHRGHIRDYGYGLIDVDKSTTDNGEQYDFFSPDFNAHFLNLLTLIGPGLDGDFNGDGTVDAADYVAWAKIDGTPAGYQAFRQNFGRTLSGSSDGPSGSVPEPSAAVLMLIAAVGMTRLRSRS